MFTFFFAYIRHQNVAGRSLRVYLFAGHGRRSRNWNRFVRVRLVLRVDDAESACDHFARSVAKYGLKRCQLQL
jgi:hypothetical protein